MADPLRLPSLDLQFCLFTPKTSSIGVIRCMAALLQCLNVTADAVAGWLDVSSQVRASTAREMGCTETQTCRPKFTWDQSLTTSCQSFGGCSVPRPCAKLCMCLPQHQLWQGMAQKNLRGRLHHHSLLRLMMEWQPLGNS